MQNLYYYTYNAAIPQCPDAVFAASANKDNPTRLTVGTIASGVIQFNRNPIIPVKPTTTSNKDAPIIAP